MGCPGKRSFARHQPDAPAREAGLEGLSERRVKGGQPPAIAEAGAIGRIDDDETRRSRRRHEFGYRPLTEFGAVADPGARRIGLAHGDGARVAVGAEKAMDRRLAVVDLAQMLPGRRVEADQLLEGKMSRAARI